MKIEERLQTEFSRTERPAPDLWPAVQARVAEGAPKRHINLRPLGILAASLALFAAMSAPFILPWMRDENIGGGGGEELRAGAWYEFDDEGDVAGEDAFPAAVPSEAPEEEAQAREYELLQGRLHPVEGTILIDLSLGGRTTVKAEELDRYLFTNGTHIYIEVPAERMHREGTEIWLHGPGPNDTQGVGMITDPNGVPAERITWGFYHLAPDRLYTVSAKGFDGCDITITSDIGDKTDEEPVDLPILVPSIDIEWVMRRSEYVLMRRSVDGHTWECKSLDVEWDSTAVEYAEEWQVEWPEDWYWLLSPPDDGSFDEGITTSFDRFGYIADMGDGWITVKDPFLSDGEGTLVPCRVDISNADLYGEPLEAGAFVIIKWEPGTFVWDDDVGAAAKIVVGKRT